MAFFQSSRPGLTINPASLWPDRVVTNAKTHTSLTDKQLVGVEVYRATNKLEKVYTLYVPCSGRNTLMG